MRFCKLSPHNPKPRRKAPQWKSIFSRPRQTRSVLIEEPKLHAPVPNRKSMCVLINVPFKVHSHYNSHFCSERQHIQSCRHLTLTFGSHFCNVSKVLCKWIQNKTRMVPSAQRWTRQALKDLATWEPRHSLGEDAWKYEDAQIWHLQQFDTASWIVQYHLSLYLRCSDALPHTEPASKHVPSKFQSSLKLKTKKCIFFNEI